MNFFKLKMDVRIAKDEELLINNISVTVVSYLGQLATGVDYFEVHLQPSDSEATTIQQALLRIGSTEGALNRELALRSAIAAYKLIGELITYSTEESVIIDTQSLQDVVADDNSEENPPDEETGDYLEEEFYEEKPLTDDIFLCSDGVWDLVSASEIAEKVETAASLQSGVEELTQSWT